jgi:hypothetical protein
MKERKKMKLTDNNKATRAEYEIVFEDLHDGEVFYCDEVVYMKLSDDVQSMGGCSMICNAVSLSDGSLASFADDEAVGRFGEEPELIYDTNTVRYTE